MLPVFAVGNEGAGASRSPGNYEEALSVGAIDDRRATPRFSSSQVFANGLTVPDLVAPGVDILSAMPGDGFGVMSGTSMAAAHVSGLAALLFGARPDASVEDVENALFASCQPGASERQRANRGVPDAVKAIETILK